MHYIQFVYFAAVLLVTTAAITEKKMGKTVLTSVHTVCYLFLSLSLAPLLAANSKTAVKDNYIVVFDENIQEKDGKKLMQ